MCVIHFLCFATLDFLLHRSRLSVWGYVRVAFRFLEETSLFIGFFFRINRPTASTYNGSRNFFNIGERNFLIRNRLAEKKKNKFRDSFSRLLITFEWNRNAMFICQRRIDVSDFTFAQKICRIFKFSVANR